MRLTFLGTGTSHGIPVIGCDCAVCQSTDPRNQRLRPAVLVQRDDTHLLVDAPPDLRLQLLRANVRRLDAVLLTHAHADHVFGLDDLRVFTPTLRHRLPLYGSAESLAEIRRILPYACTENPPWLGVPLFQLMELTAHQSVLVRTLRVEALPVRHGRMTVFGFLFDERLAYITDCNDVPDSVIERLRGVPVLVLDALRQEPHPTHLSIGEALAVVERIQPRQTYFTHMCHRIDHASTEAALPPHVRLAYDGLQLDITDGGAHVVA